ncbi:phage tail protein [Pseudoalteromonas sp. T1lg65]|uniref:phage tail protein n=1 Tax=Pseudoalteromonas sp. T1lg65 TaxID=2077101 RepID=UPI003F7B1183
MKKSASKKPSRVANKVKHQLPKQTQLAHQVAKLGALVDKLNQHVALDTESPNVEQQLAAVIQINLKQLLGEPLSKADLGFAQSYEGDSKSEQAAEPKKVAGNTQPPALFALSEQLVAQLSGLNQRLDGLDLSALKPLHNSAQNSAPNAAAQTISLTAPQLSTSSQQAQNQAVTYAQQTENAAVQSAPASNTNGLNDQVSAVLSNAPTVLNQLGFEQAADTLAKFTPALNQIDVAKVMEGDLQSLKQALPELAKTVDFSALNQSVAKHIPAFSQLDLAAVAQGDLASVLDTMPALLDGAGLSEVSQQFSAALPAFQQLDMAAIAKGDLNSLLDSAPAALSAFGFDKAASVLEQHKDLFTGINVQGVMQGDLSSLLDSAPAALSAFGFDQAASVLEQHKELFSGIDVQGVMKGDLSSLLDSAPAALNALGFDKAASFLEQNKASLASIDVQGVLKGDLTSLLDSAPAMLNSLGFDKAASFLEQHKESFASIDVQGLIKGDLSSLQGAVGSMLEPFGLDGVSDSAFDLLDADSQEDEEKDKRKKGKSGKKGKKKGKGRKGKNSARKKPAKPALKLLEGGKGQEQDNAKSNKAAKQGTSRKGKGAKNTGKVLNRAAANDAKYSKLGRFSPKKLLKSPTRLLGRAAAPLTVALGAFDAFSALTDDTLTGKQKTQKVGAAAGGMGGALAGAAAGAAIGSVIPVFGTALGGLVGGALGAIGGESVGGFLGDTLGGWLFGDDDEEVNSSAQTSNLQQAKQSPHSSTANTALDFVKNDVINPFNMALGTVAANDQNNGVKNSRALTLSKLGGYVGDALNYHTVASTAMDNSKSATEKASTIGGTLAGMYSSKLVTNGLVKVKHPAVRLMVPLAGFLTNSAVGNATSEFVGNTPAGKSLANWMFADKAPDNTKAPQLSSEPQQLNASNPTIQSQTSASPSATPASVTVNANITVNATDGKQAKDIAVEVKQLLEQQQQHAMHELSARYFNQVA